jgi:small conductance mechanosensitive channel
MRNLLSALDLGAAEAAVTQAARIAVILLLAWVLQRIASRLIQGFHAYMAGRARADELTRMATVGRVLRYAATVIIAVLAGTLVLGELGISVAPILATAGIAGIAVGFGAQSLIKDYFNGFFLLVEDQIREGDVVEVAGRGGVVEEMTLRYIRLRDVEGHVHFVPNGEITLVTNRTRDFATPVIDVGIAYREDPEQALGVLQEVAAKMRAEAPW